MNYFCCSLLNWSQSLRMECYAASKLKLINHASITTGNPFSTLQTQNIFISAKSIPHKHFVLPKTPHAQNSMTKLISTQAIKVNINQAIAYASQHIWCLSQSRINWEGCGRKGIWYKNGDNDGDGDTDSPYEVTSSQIVGTSALHNKHRTWHVSPNRCPTSGWMFLLVPAHPGSPRQRAIKRLLFLLYKVVYVVYFVPTEFNKFLQLQCKTHQWIENCLLLKLAVTVWQQQIQIHETRKCKMANSCITLRQEYVNHRVPKSVDTKGNCGHFRSSEQHVNRCFWPLISNVWFPISVLQWPYT